MTLVEVMIATMVLGIMTVGGSMFFVNSARLRERARGIQAATIEANSLMESAYGTLKRSYYSPTVVGYFSREMSHSSGPPTNNNKWEFDGVWYPILVRFTAVSGSTVANPAVNVTVTVTYNDDYPPVVLTAYRHCGED